MIKAHNYIESGSLLASGKARLRHRNVIGLNPELFPYGWLIRWVATDDGGERPKYILLTLRDLLDPQEGDR
jgi:hypothetical protein